MQFLNMKISSMFNIVVLGPAIYEDRSDEVNKRNPNAGPVVITSAPVSIKLKQGMFDYTTEDCDNRTPNFKIEDILTWPAFKSLRKSGKVTIILEELDDDAPLPEHHAKTLTTDLPPTSLVDDAKK